MKYDVYMRLKKTRVANIPLRKHKVSEIATFCGVARATVYNWINGTNFPTPKNIKKLRELEELDKKK